MMVQSLEGKSSLDARMQELGKKEEEAKRRRNKKRTKEERQKTCGAGQVSNGEVIYLFRFLSYHLSIVLRPLSSIIPCYLCLFKPASVLDPVDVDRQTSQTSDNGTSLPVLQFSQQARRLRFPQVAYVLFFRVVFTNFCVFPLAHTSSGYNVPDTS